MEAYATALTYAIPGFIILILIEALASWWMGKPINRAMDTISSLSSGMTNTLKDLLGLSVVILSYGWMVQHWALFSLTAYWWVFVLAFIGIDFASYWSHRFNHEINVMWNRHQVHHSSEEFNLSCALRQSISGIFGVYFFLYIPMAIIGIPLQVIAILAPLHLFAQFWYHTRLIDRMGFLEHIIVTPSHHRVHHAINPQYIDKNYAAIFIVWDKWFGTFQEELKDEPPVYGTLKPVNTWNPVVINFLHDWQLIKDAWRTKNWKDKFRIWFMPTGWRPADVTEKYPIQKIDDVHSRPKYDTSASNTLKGWSWFQLIFHNVLMFYILANFAAFDYGNIVLGFIFLFISIFAYTTLMDNHPVALAAELLKLGFGIFIIQRMGGWYGIDAFFSGATYIMIGYLFISFAMTIYFLYFESKQKEVIASI